MPVAERVAHGFDLSHARRSESYTPMASSPSRTAEKQDSISPKSTGKMFIQFGFEQRVEGEVKKGDFISFNIPGMFGQSENLLDAVNGAIPQPFSGLNQNKRSFNDDKTLVASFAQSTELVTNEVVRQTLGSILSAVENFVLRNKDTILDEELDKFMHRIDNYRLLTENIVRDSQFIFSNPEHGGLRAYRNLQQFGFVDPEFHRMEMIDDGNVILTVAPPHKHYEITVYDQNLTKDPEDAEFMITLLNFIKSSFGGGANSVFFLQINSTATIADCGGNNSYNALHSESLSIQVQSNIQTPPSSMNAANSLGDAIQAAIQSTTSSVSSQSGGGDIGNTGLDTKIMCSNCGKINDQNIPMCSCRIKALKKGGEIAPISSHHPNHN